METTSKDDRLLRKEDPKFVFPFPPYQIQQDFMGELYKTLEDGCVGIFESPTGTGKSLSIICGALLWLKDHTDNVPVAEKNVTQFFATESKVSVLKQAFEEEKEKIQKSTVESSSNVPDWARASFLKRQEDKKRQEEEERQEKLLKQQKKIQKLKRELNAEESPQKKIKKNQVLESPTNKKNEWEEFLIDEYESDEEKKKAKKQEADPLAKFNLKELYDSSDDESYDFLDEEEVDVRKIYYCSRTHSQLSQFVHEIRKTIYAKNTRVITLGSRKSLCINDKVQALKSQNRINDACLDMQKATLKKDKETRKKKYLMEQVDDRNVQSSCPYFSQPLQKIFKDHLFTKVQDIEDMVKLGKQQHTCPYYGSRKGVKSAELVILPYNSLLHKSTRQTLDINLKGNIVIIDEAHNIIDAISTMYSQTVSYAQISMAHSQLSEYFSRYKSKLKPNNVNYIQQILQTLQALLNYIKKASAEDGKIMRLSQFTLEANIQNFNLFKVEKFIKESDIVKKLNGFFDKVNQMQAQVQTETKTEDDEDDDFLGVDRHRPALGIVNGFIEALNTAEDDGRVVLSINGKHGHVIYLTAQEKNSNKSYIKFLLLNPEAHFTEVLEEARAVILAGGTMQPTSDFASQLVSTRVTPEKLRFFSCGHIIPPENLLTIAFEKGPSGVEFDFTWKSRETMDELGRMILNIVNIVPDGIIVFFPSYSYEEKIVNHWTKSKVIDKIEQKKKFIREPKSTNKVDETLKLYQTCIENSSSASDHLGLRGALLSCVVGGKMSEGINFSDSMGRCVVMVGLPFPNPNDPVLKEKIEYINKLQNKLGSTQPATSGSDYYDNLCMKAVNQSIGRSIRHKNDYATIVLLDKRYQTARISNKLPKWIGDTVKKPNSFGEGFGAISKFFAGKKSFQAQIEQERAKHKSYKV